MTTGGGGGLGAFPAVCPLPEAHSATEHGWLDNSIKRKTIFDRKKGKSPGMTPRGRLVGGLGGFFGGFVLHMIFGEVVGVAFPGAGVWSVFAGWRECVSVQVCVG